MRSRRLLWAFALLVYGFLYLPLLIVIAYSFNDSKLNAEWVGFTLRWYQMLARDERMLEAARNTLLIALLSSAMATLLGTLAGFALYRQRSRMLAALVLAPLAMPEILMGLALLLFFVALNVTLGMVSIVLAHITFSIGFVAVVVRARLEGMDETLLDAARDLGAGPFTAFRLVTLPLILPGVMVGALMAFTLSVDDFVVTFFVAGPGSATLPLQIYSMLKVAVTPEVNAISTLLMLLTLSLILLARRLAPELLERP